MRENTDYSGRQKKLSVHKGANAALITFAGRDDRRTQ
jgi:hypothetical protein